MAPIGNAAATTIEVWFAQGFVPEEDSAFQAMAADYARYSIRVNAICPAAVLTPMLERWCDDQPDPAATRQLLDSIHLLCPAPRGDVIADVAVFLLSNRSRFMTGCIVPVSGGAELGYRRS